MPIGWRVLAASEDLKARRLLANVHDRHVRVLQPGTLRTHVYQCCHQLILTEPPKASCAREKERTIQAASRRDIESDHDTAGISMRHHTARHDQARRTCSARLYDCMPCPRSSRTPIRPAHNFVQFGPSKACSQQFRQSAALNPSPRRNEFARNSPLGRFKPPTSSTRCPPAASRRPFPSAPRPSSCSAWSRRSRSSS